MKFNLIAVDIDGMEIESRIVAEDEIAEVIVGFFNRPEVHQVMTFRVKP